MSDTLSLATRLRGMPNDALAAAMRGRALSATGIKDFFDLAEAFLDRGSVQQALSRLDRDTLAILAAIGEAAAPSTAADVRAALERLGGTPPSVAAIEERTRLAAELLLVETESQRYAAYENVREQLRSWPAFGLPGLAELATVGPPGALEPVPDVDRRFIDRLAAERAFAATTELTELLLGVEREPARELARGGIALPDTKRLAGAMSVELESVAPVLAIADRAGLVALQAGFWMITTDGGDWLLASSGERWSRLAGSWFTRLPVDIRDLLSERTHALWGQGLRGFIDWLYPAGGAWMEERVVSYTRDAELLGITANQAPSTPGSLLLAEGVEAAGRAMTELFPAEVEQVYLQHDLSIVAPGPLTPAVDARLRGVAEVESRALASTYRVTTSSVNRALAAGETAQSLRAFLSGISLSGLPQPLDYLIGEAAGRYGQVRVGARDDGAYVRSDDPDLLRTIAVDQNLGALSLEPDGHGALRSRFEPDIVFWSLSDARYPVAAENPAHEIVELRRRRATRAAPASTSDPVAALIERLRVAAAPAEGEDQDAWLLRQLDVAIRAHAALTVSVRVPGGEILDYQLEPTSVASGRMRARDRRAAIERTLPLSSIVGLAPPL